MLRCCAVLGVNSTGYKYNFPLLQIFTLNRHWPVDSALTCILCALRHERRGGYETHFRKELSVEYDPCR